MTDHDLTELQQLGRQRNRLRRQLAQLRPEWQQHIRAAYAAGIPGPDIAQAAACGKNYVYQISEPAHVLTGEGVYDMARLQDLGQRRARITEQLAEIQPRWEQLIRKACAADAMQMEIARAAGVTREAVRQLCLPPEQRQAELARRRQRTRNRAGTSG